MKSLRSLTLVLTLGALAGAGLYLAPPVAHPGIHIPPPDDALDPGDSRHEALAQSDTVRWVTVSEPASCYRGYTLLLFQRRVPVLVDMNGRVVHTWPKVRAWSRARLASDGSLAVLGVDNYLKEYNWSGRLEWYYRPPLANDLLHHDFTRLANGDYLLLVQEHDGGLDNLLEVDRRGDTAWTWRIADHLDELPPADLSKQDPTHCNSVQELPANPRYDAGDERFRPGNILVSARNLNCIFIIDRDTGEVVWRYEDGLDYQHEARMISSGNVGEGLIAVFNNCKHDLGAYRHSSVLAIDPASRRTVWRFAADGFFSSVAGSAQPLPNGNALVSSSQGGRIFEVTATGRIVWQLEPSFLPMRPHRYPTDYCPQFAHIARRPYQPVTGTRSLPFIDKELYAYILPGRTQFIRNLHGRRRELVREPKSSRVVWLPPRPRITIAYGLDPGPLGRAQIQAHFRATLEPLPGGRPRMLVDDDLDSGAVPLWRERAVTLDGLGYRRVRLRLDATWHGDLGERRGDRVVRWQNPRVVSRARPELPDEPALARERRFREQQLRTIGYLQ